MIKMQSKIGKHGKYSRTRKPLEYSPPHESYFAHETGNKVCKKLNISINSTFQEQQFTASLAAALFHHQKN